LELAIVLVLVAATGFTVLVVVNKVAFLNCFYIPVLVAAYFLGKKRGVLTGAVAVLLVALYAAIDPRIFRGSLVELPFVNIVLWGAFLIITAYVVGSLYDLKEGAMSDLRQAYEGIVEILAKFIDAVDKYTKEHSVRVSDLAARIAQGMGLPGADVDNVRVAGLLHDVGKIEISVDVLRKAADLSADEWAHVKTHTTKATAVLKPVGGLLKEVIPLIVTHHECFDGSGYHNLESDDIPIGARILAVADAYDSMISDRPYRAGRPPWEAVAEIQKHSGTQFDPHVVKVFSTIVQRDVQYA
jgi:putative nucleotidyltransferase with HDIG domain